MSSVKILPPCTSRGPLSNGWQAVQGIFSSKSIWSSCCLCSPHSVYHAEYFPRGLLQTELATMNFQWFQIKHSGMSYHSSKWKKGALSPLVTKIMICYMTVLFPFCKVNFGKNSTGLVYLTLIICKKSYENLPVLKLPKQPLFFPWHWILINAL